MQGPVQRSSQQPIRHYPQTFHTNTPFDALQDIHAVNSATSWSADRPLCLAVSINQHFEALNTDADSDVRSDMPGALLEAVILHINASKRTHFDRDSVPYQDIISCLSTLSTQIGATPKICDCIREYQNRLKEKIASDLALKAKTPYQKGEKGVMSPWDTLKLEFEQSDYYKSLNEEILRTYQHLCFTMNNTADKDGITNKPEVNLVIKEIILNKIVTIKALLETAHFEGTFFVSKILGTEAIVDYLNKGEVTWEKLVDPLARTLIDQIVLLLQKNLTVQEYYQNELLKFGHLISIARECSSYMNSQRKQYLLQYLQNPTIKAAILAKQITMDDAVSASDQEIAVILNNKTEVADESCIIS